MAAGLGFKTFTTGEVLTAANVNGYLMQGILVFASAAARDSAITSPQEGQACYLKDTNQVLTYSGSAWVAVGGGSPLTTKGDLYGFSTVDARIPIGTNNQVLTADSAQALGLKWATPASGKLLQVVSAISDTQVSTTTSATAKAFTDVSGFTATITPTSATSKIMVLVQVSVYATTDAGNRIYLRLVRDSTAISVGTGGTGVQCSASTFTNSAIAHHSDNTPINFVDSPATTSATTYKIQVASNGATQTVRFNGGGSTAADTGLTTTQIILMEIGA